MILYDIKGCYMILYYVIFYEFILEYIILNCIFRYYTILN